MTVSKLLSAALVAGAGVSAILIKHTRDLPPAVPENSEENQDVQVHDEHGGKRTGGEKGENTLFAPHSVVFEAGQQCFWRPVTPP